MSMKPEEIEKKILAYNPEVDVGLFRKAYDFIENAHKGQTRVSGEPYVVHPLEVADILASLRLDIITIVAGLLHDALEDTPTKLEQVKEIFGMEVSFLVDGLTKLSRIEFKTREEQQAESFRKMLLAMAKDIRIILIKLADRIHNMRTLEHLSPDKKTSIAQETLDIYAPIANRLGIGWMKTELEDLSLKYLHTSEYEDLVKKVAKREEERKDYINDVIDEVKNALKRENLTGDVRGRPKHYYGVYQKMLKQGISFEQVYDLIGIRIITETKADCYAILGVIHSLWTPVPGRYKDFIGLPKPNGYQSLHTTVIGPKGERVEFQIRTHEMNSIAEEGIAAHWRYKEKVPIGESDMERFGWLRQLIDLQQDLTEAKDFFDTIKVDLFPDVVYVFTPRGDVKELPRGSTPIDFAYSIHSDIGHHCAGSRVNGKIVPLKYQLKNGDSVEIQTSATHIPSRDWLKFVVTPRAKTRIKQWIKAEERKRSFELGRELLEREFKRHDHSPSVIKSKEMTEIANGLGFQGTEEMLVAIGYGKVSALQVINRLVPEKVKEEEMPIKRPLKKEKGERGVMVKGIDDILIHFSKCCSPIPGDKIIGFITRGRGVSIHTEDCSNVIDLAVDKDRLIDVDWEQDESTHPVRISVYTVDKPGLLANVSSAITSAEVNISQANISTTEDKKAYLNFVVEVKDLNQLVRVIKKVEQVEGVLDVKRIKTA